jgi:S1-C subfamily serine protease
MKKIGYLFILILLTGIHMRAFASNSYLIDVSESNPYLKSIQKMQQLGIMEGQDGRFSPQQTVTRQELADALNRLFNQMDASENITTVVANVTPLTVKVTVDATIMIPQEVGWMTQFGVSIGSGAVVGEHKIITNNHVVQGRTDNGKIFIRTSDGQTAEAVILAADAASDLALLEVPGITFPRSFEFAQEIKQGETVLAIGHPGNKDYKLDYTVSRGIVSFPERRINDWKKRIQLNISINNGNSGGPLVNHKGELIGIITSSMNSPDMENIAFAVTNEDVLKLMNKIKK